MNKFKYTFSSPTEDERKEIESIKKQYSPSNQQSKLERLRKLDKKVKNVPIIISLLLGIIGTLIFGLGITMVLEWNLLWWGVGVALVGIIPIASAYFVYNLVFTRLKNNYSEEILTLSEELLKNIQTTEIK